ncbi:MAG TPA: OmpA family protein [Bryobacteraceae bacterium]|nr:OmpA family protein [Bryobacteraceae bacterium]
MFKKSVAWLAVAAMSAIALSAQGLNTNASKDDWEEINFEYNSAVLSDGYPSLLRLAELLQKNPGYHVRLEGHTDDLGGGQYNDKLGLARANTVRDFLVKYGARPSQIDVGTRGKADPKYPGQKPTYSRTDVPRWMNRRVVMTVTDDQGRTVSAAGVGEAIRAIEPKQAAAMTDCCSEVLKRLDKLDDIARMLQALQDQNAQLRHDLDALKQQQQVLESKANQPTTPPPSAQEVAKAVETNLNQNKQPKFQLLGVNVGADQDGNVTATGRGRFFGVFEDHFAIQAEAEYMYFKTHKEGQFDIGLVDRVGRFQAGLFSSIKNVSLTLASPNGAVIPGGLNAANPEAGPLAGVQGNGTLGQAAFTMDYLFHWGKIGAFGTYGFKNTALLSSIRTTLPNGIISPDLFTDTYLEVVNQAGASATVGLWGNNYLEGSLSYLKSFTYGDRAGGTLRFVFPINQHIAISVEGDLNPTMVGPSNNGQALVGVIFGNAQHPKDYLAGASSAPVPMMVPRVQWEQVTRTIRTGHTPPVANAGPNQIGVPAGPITLNGSASYSPDELALTYQWTQVGGPTVTLSSPANAITSFPATAGETYVFQLTVTDSLGAQGQSRVTVTTISGNRVNIGYFTANPSTIQAGQSTTLSWSVTGATAVSVSGIGSVQAVGTSSVAPTSTTTYILTATAAGGTVTAQTTVVVSGSTTQVTYCYASPATVIAGESSTLYWQTANATQVTVNPGGQTFAPTGNTVVTPTSNTTYTIIAMGANGNSNSCNASVTVTTGQLPRVIQFSSSPQNITAGQSSTLTWAVDNATSVSINGVGNSLSLGGTQSVSPAVTTTYTLTATNAAGSVTSTTTINVSAAVSITAFTASPNPSPSSGASVTLTCTAANASSINLNGSNYNGGSATVNVAPLATTAYTCIATAASGQTVQQSLTVTVPAPSTSPTGPTGGQQPVIVIQGGTTVNTIFRFITLNASGTYSPSGNNPLSYVWVAVNNNATITNANSPTPSVTLGLTSGVYLFQLTVTDSKGNQATALVTVNFTI